MPENQDPKPFNLEEWEKDPKHQKSREAFDAMVQSSANRAAQKKAEEDKKKEQENAGKLPFPFNLFSG